MLVVHVVHFRLCRSRHHYTTSEVPTGGCFASVEIIAFHNAFSGGAEDRQKKQMCFLFQFFAGMNLLWSNAKTLNLKLSMAALVTTVGSASLDGAEVSKKSCVLHAIFLDGSRF